VRTKKAFIPVSTSLLVTTVGVVPDACTDGVTAVLVAVLVGVVEHAAKARVNTPKDKAADSFISHPFIR